MNKDIKYIPLKIRKELIRKAYELSGTNIFPCISPHSHNGFSGYIVRGCKYYQYHYNVDHSNGSSLTAQVKLLLKEEV